ncbi:MAG TPA: hypothetical protein VLJ21_04505 [Candidatus Binatia bacterium]|nr:hypothetical protein [Candidatus Binatia bacterium]
MWYQVGVILLIIAFLVYLGAAFGGSLAVLLVNGTLLFLVVYRGYYEFKAGWQNHQLVGAGVAFLLLIFFGNYGSPFWPATTFAVTAYAGSAAAHFLAQKLKNRRSF